MTHTDIITNQFVRIAQTQASIAERISARIIDGIWIFVICISVFYACANFLEYDGAWWLMWIFGIGIWLWDFLWETFNDGKTPGKMIMKIRVVNKDGSRPNLGSFFMRWLLGNIDIGCSCVGILFILLTKDSQRLGDLAAGTIVIKEVNIEDIHVSLDEFYYAKKDYHPTYEEAKNLSQAQVEVIEKTVYSGNDKHEEQVDALARKVAKFLGIEERLKASLQKGNSKEKFLATILHDYNYYLMELI